MGNSVYTILISNRYMRTKLTNNWVRPSRSPWESLRTAYCVSGFLLEFIPHRDAGQELQTGDSMKLSALGCITPLVSKYTETSKKAI